VLVENDSIAAVGEEAARRAAQADIVRIDARGMTVMPGLIDAHCHVSFDDAHSNAEIYLPSPQRAIGARGRVQRRKVLRAVSPASSIPTRCSSARSTCAMRSKLVSWKDLASRVARTP
jgi:hypothetical protein